MISYRKMRYKSALIGLLGLSSQAVFSDTLPIACTPDALATAITAANNAYNSTGSGLVILPAGCVYVIQTPATVTDALPVITGNVVIVGGEGSVIARSPSAANFRIFEVNPGASLTLRNLAVENGNILDSGGGILVNSNANLVVKNVRFSHNSGVQGSAFRADPGAIVKVIDSNFFLNGSQASQAGGGIVNLGNLEITNSRFTGNTASEGGAIFSSQTGITNISHSVFINNSAIVGGAVLNQLNSIVNINYSLIQFNTATINGGGIYNSSAFVTLKHAQVINNTPNNCFPVNTINGCVN